MSRRPTLAQINLAKRCTSAIAGLSATVITLSDPSIALTETDLSQMESTLLDTLSAFREFRRKINPVEIKGQRL
jgi:hypothetical protein